MRFHRRGGAVVLLGGLAAYSTPSSAQEAAEDRAQSFRAVEGAVQEDVPGGPLMLASYGLIWVLLLLYVIRLARQQEHTRAAVERLEALLGKGSAARD